MVRADPLITNHWQLSGLNINWNNMGIKPVNPEQTIKFSLNQIVLLFIIKSSTVSISKSLHKLPL